MPQKKKQKEQYVTKTEFEEAMHIIKKSFDHIATKDQVEELDTRLTLEIGSVKSTVESILKIVESIDGQMKEHRDIPERVTRLEEDSFKHDVQIRQLQNK